MKTTAAPNQSLRRPEKRNVIRNRLSRFVFTLNNYTKKELTSIKAFPCKWMIVGKEVSTTGTPHLQGACVIGGQKEYSTVKKYYGFKRAAVFTMKGTPSDSLAYCSKEDTHPFIKGDMPKPGKRNDIHDVVTKLRSGRTLVDLIKSDDDEGSIAALVRYHRGFQYVASILTPARTEPPTVVWIHGTTGTHKTRCAVKLGCDVGGPDGFWLSSGSLRWFDGYVGQPVAIFDDLRTKHARFWELLRLLDRYAMRVEIKGGSVHWTPKFIIITAPKSPSDMWNLRCNEDIEQLVRRCHVILDSSDYLNYSSMVLDLQTKIHEARTLQMHGNDRGHDNMIIISEEEMSTEMDTSIDLTDLDSDEEDPPKADELEGAETLCNLTQLFKHADKAFK